MGRTWWKTIRPGYERRYLRIRRESCRDGVAVCRQILGLGEGDDPLRDRAKRIPVVTDDLLRAEERVRTQPRRETRLATRRQHVVRAGQVIAAPHRGVRSDEDGTTVLDNR